MVLYLRHLAQTVFFTRFVFSHCANEKPPSRPPPSRARSLVRTGRSSSLPETGDRAGGLIDLSRDLQLCSSLGPGCQIVIFSGVWINKPPICEEVVQSKWCSHVAVVVVVLQTRIRAPPWPGSAHMVQCSTRRTPSILWRTGRPHGQSTVDGILQRHVSPLHSSYTCCNLPHGT